MRTGIRPISVKFMLALIKTLIEPGVITASEYSVASVNLKHLAKAGELAPAVKPKLLTGPEAAEMLAISYSQFRTLEREGAFPFRRRLIGGKTVRFLNTDIVEYMLTGSLQGEGADEGGGDDV